MIRCSALLPLLLVATFPPVSESRGQWAFGYPSRKMQLSYCVVDPPFGLQTNMPPVIMLHGMLDSKLTWITFAPKIAALTGRRVYYLDARNHGDSPWNEVFNFDVLADDLNDFMDMHHIPRAVLIGHSMGGKTALTLALRRPEKVEKLIVEDMTVKNLSSNEGNFVVQSLRLLREAVKEIPDGTDQRTARQIVGAVMANFIPEDTEPKTDEERAFRLLQVPIRRVGCKYAWKANLDVIEKTLVTPGAFHQQLRGQYRGGALFLYGPNSVFQVKRDEELIKHHFPNAQLVEVEGAGHLIHHGQPERFLQEVVNFINEYPTITAKQLRSKY